MKTSLSFIATMLIILQLSWLSAGADEPASVATPAKTLDLASETAWQASADGGDFRPIIVPGGGWNSDKQPAPGMRPLTRHEEPDGAKLNYDPRGGFRFQPALAKYNQDLKRPVIIRDHVVYRRDITIPADWAGRSIQLEFGGVNYGADVFLDGKEVGGHVGPMMPFTVDLTGVTSPGKTHRLEVNAYSNRHYNINGMSQVPNGFDYEYFRTMHNPSWTSKTAYGIVKYIRLTALPPQHTRDLAVRTSVKDDAFGFEVTVANTSDKPAELELSADLSSWNKADWKYPAIPARKVTVPAKSKAKVTVDGVKWGLGSKSYWWPNMPFREDYRAQLHLLNLTLRQDGKPVAKSTQRFGFVEHAEGPYYYTVNGVRVTGLSDATAEAQLSEFDAYAQLPAYKTADACRETWKRFMRIGINTNRIHQSTPTDLMMDAADEVGFMLIPETGLRGCHNQGWHPPTMRQAVSDMIVHARNHPSTARYSLQNEMDYDKAMWTVLIDAGVEADSTRPLVMEDNTIGRKFPIDHSKFEGTRGHACGMGHYVDYPKPCRKIIGLGEMDWGNNRLPAYVVHVRDYRLNDVAYFASWSWLNFWPNFLEGGNHAKHGWKVNNDHDRIDGLDGWNSPIIDFAIRCHHPYLVQDIGVLKENPGAPKEIGGGKIQWPYNLPIVLAGKPVERKIEVFNGGLFGNKLSLRWNAHWDSPTGPEAVKGGEIPNIIEPGFHATQTIAFIVPKIEKDERTLVLMLESVMDGQVVFRSEETRLKVLARMVETSAAFLGEDSQTQGDWEGKFGTDGHELVGHEAKLPATVKLTWTNGKVWTYDKATDDKRALTYFMNPPTGKDRIAAAHYGDEVTFFLDVGPTSRRLTLYFLDYDRKERRQTIEIANAQGGQVLDKREIADFANGRYLSWKIQGKVKIILHKLAGDNACISGIFLDPATAKTEPLSMPVAIKPKTWSIASPDGKLVVTVADQPSLSFSAMLDGQAAIPASPLGITLEKAGNFPVGFKFLGKSQAVIDETYAMPVGKRRQCRNQANELTLDFGNDQGARISLIVRAYDEGLAYRYRINGEGTDTVAPDEASGLCLPPGSAVWFAPYSACYESIYARQEKWTEFKGPIQVPLLFKTPAGIWGLATEAAVEGTHAGAGLWVRDGAAGLLRYSCDGKSTATLPWSMPWRVTMLGNTLKPLVESTMINSLNPPSKIADTSWIKPGATIFPWGCEPLTSNGSLERMKQYIDLAAAEKWPWLEFETSLALFPDPGAWGKDPKLWMGSPYFRQVTDYAKSKNILVYGWDCIWNLNTPEKQKALLDWHVENGFAGIKIDFMNSDQQTMYRLREELAQACAERKLLVSYHGDITPRGMARTWPNIATHEGVKGEEFYLAMVGGGAQGPTPKYNVNLVFTRNIPGSMDYTPVSLDPAALGPAARKTTTAHEMALPVVFESGWMCLSVTPEAAKKHPEAMAFLKCVPTVWDDTRFLAGAPDEFAVVARRQGNDWWIAGINAGTAREVTVKLDFLKAGNYPVTLYRDAGTDPDPMKTRVMAEPIELDAAKPLVIPVPANGGFGFKVIGK